jgi:hypothetical protein
MYVLIMDYLRVVAESPEAAEDHSPDERLTSASTSTANLKRRDEGDDNQDPFAALMTPSKRARTTL